MKNWLVGVVAAATLLSGALNLYSVMGRSLPGRAAIVMRVVPLEFVHLAKFVTLLCGFALVISSVNLWKRKRRAWQLVVLLTPLSMTFHLTKGLDYEEAGFSLLLLGLLLATRSGFTVGSSIPDLRWGLARMGVALAAALGYGIAGFWLLDPREFGINFHIGDAIQRTLLFLTLQGDPGIVPHTRHARWFLDSLYLMTSATLVYSLAAVFRPVIYRYRTLPQERILAEAIVKKHGQHGLDFFKFRPDKSFFFSASGQSFLAYRVGGGHAMVLGDPVGLEEEFEGLVRAFDGFCRENDWRLAFYQTVPDHLPLYKKLGFRKLKIGDDAIIDLTRFQLGGKQYRKMKAKVTAMEKDGVRLVRYEVPVADELLAKAREISESWLQIPGRRERTFAQGFFDEDYVRWTPVYAAVDAMGRVLAFVNEIPAYGPGEATLDLMRHRVDAPPGIMDYIFTKVMVEKKEQGFLRFNMGMAPMSGFQEREKASLEERAVHHFIQRLSFLFSYQGLRHYKAKFATGWEPRYLVYRNVLTLPLVAKSIAAVSEFHD